MIQFYLMSSLARKSCGCTINITISCQHCKYELSPVTSCRLKDEPAKALYERGGFGLEKEDCFLVSLFDDRRRLLSKFIPQNATQEIVDDFEPEETLQTEY